VLPHDITQPGPTVDAADPLAEFNQLADALAMAAQRNAKQATGTSDASESKDFAQAALYATQALVALVPYKDPGAPGAPGDNPAKKGD
jgi:hypothetical protein